MAKDIVGFGERSLEELSFQEMMDAGVVDISDIDDVVVVDQAELVGVPLILFSWEIKSSQTYGGVYALCRVKTADGTRVFADGGTGICEQLERYKQRMMNDGLSGFEPIYMAKGLRVSSYQKEVDGKMIPAKTYYFDNGPAA